MTSSRRSAQLLRVFNEYEAVVAVTRDNPDPDAVASCWALSTLVRAKLNKPVRSVAGAAIVGAENRRMTELLPPPIDFVEKPPWFASTMLIFCWPWETHSSTVPRRFVSFRRLETRRSSAKWQIC